MKARKEYSVKEAVLPEVSKVLNRLRLPPGEPERLEDVFLIPVSMNGYRGLPGQNGRRDSFHALTELGLEVIGLIAEGNNSEYIVARKEGMTIEKDIPTRTTHKWWTVRYCGIALLQINKDEAVRFKETFLNVL